MHIKNEIKWRILLLLFALPAPLTALAAESAPVALLRKLTSLSGASAIDCGAVALPADRNTAVACAKKSAVSGSAYRVAFQLQSTDSKMWQGAAGDGRGNLWVAFYDLDTASGADDNPTLSTVRCRDILFVVKGGDILDCQPVSGVQP